MVSAIFASEASKNTKEITARVTRVKTCQSAALVARDGSIDWLCLPRFDSGACFAALLGTPEQRRWLIAPAREVQHTARRYRGHTLVLETEFHNADAGRCADRFHGASQRPGRRCAHRRRPRRARADAHGPRYPFDYGAVVPWVRQIERGIRAIAGPDTLYLRTPVNTRGEKLHTVAEFTVAEGERVPFDLSWSPTYGTKSPDKDAEEALRQTEQWWREWTSRCTYRGGWRDAVLRSLITLRAAHLFAYWRHRRRAHDFAPGAHRRRA